MSESNLTTSEIFLGREFAISEIWQCTPRLRWKIDGWRTELPPTLQQLWLGQSGEIEWRDVPIAEPGDDSA